MRKWLLIAFLLVIACFIAEGVFGRAPLQMGRYLLAELGDAIGMHVSISPNQFNSLAEELRDKELSLEEKDRLLREKEAALQRVAFAERFREDGVFRLLVVGGGALFVLIALNFYFDWRRRGRKEAGNEPSAEHGERAQEVFRIQ